MHTQKSILLNYTAREHIYTKVHIAELHRSGAYLWLEWKTIEEKKKKRRREVKDRKMPNRTRRSKSNGILVDVVVIWNKVVNDLLRK